MSTSIISTGTTYRIFDSSVETHDELPLATYRVRFSPMEGFSLQRTSDLEVGTEKVYGNHARRISRILSAYNQFDRSLGVLLSGDKGMGKSLTIRMLADEARRKLSLPVIVVDSNAPGLADFLDSLGEVMVVFDEFEKVFPSGGGDDDAQQQFLSLFDGISTTRRLYVISANQVHHLSDYLVNRPGRFHYHIRFDYPDADQVREYLRDQAPRANATEIEQAVIFSRKVNLNYDHLRAIAFELNHGGEAFADIIGDLNIKRVDTPVYQVKTTFDDGTSLSTIERLDLFHSLDEFAEASVCAWKGRERIEYSFDTRQVIARGTKLMVPMSAVSVECKTPDLGEVESVTLSLTGQQDIGF